MIASERALCAAQFARDVACATGVNKPDVLAAVVAADAWIETAFANYTAALPAPINASSAVFRAQILAYVLWRKIGRRIAQEA